jgi:hypothetical protein
MLNGLDFEVKATPRASFISRPETYVVAEFVSDQCLACFAAYMAASAALMRLSLESPSSG